MTTHTTTADIITGKTLYHETDDCGRCSGKGRINYWSHVANGVCFLCGGSKRITKTFKTTAEHRAKLAAKREAKKETKRLAGLPVHTLNRITIIVTVTLQAAYDAAERDTWTAIVEGKRNVSGTVLAAKWNETQYGSTLKMLVKLDTAEKVWGTVPRAIENVYHAAIDSGEEEGGDLKGWIRGKTVSFSATFERSDSDEKFGFFRRPSKAKVAA